MTQETIRISRPLGITIKALEGKREEVYEICSRKFLQGTFPYNMRNLSMERFSMIFKIPLKALHAVVKNGLEEETLLGGQDLRGKLEEVRSRLLNSSLYQYGTSTARLHRLLNYLEDRIYSSRSSEPSLIRELNTAIASAFKGIDSSSKVLQLINEALVSVQGPATEEGTLTSTQILEILQEKPRELGPGTKLLQGLPDLDIEGMLDYIKDCPDLSPLKSQATVSLIPLEPPKGDYTKARELKEQEIPEVLLINPR